MLCGQHRARPPLHLQQTYATLEQAFGEKSRAATAVSPAARFKTANDNRSHASEINSMRIALCHRTHTLCLTIFTLLHQRKWQRKLSFE